MRPLGVLIDATNYKPRQAGIATYTRGMVGALAEHPGLAPSVVTSVPADFDGVPGLRVIEAPASSRDYLRRTAWRERHLARMVRETSAEAVMILVPEAPLRRLAVPTVVVVHDVGPLVAPALFSTAKWVRFALDLRRVCRVATHLVCVSNATMLGLHAALGVPPERCSVIGLGTRARGARQSSHVRDGDYLLYAGVSFDARGRPDRQKNVTTLLAALSAGPSTGPRLLMIGPLEASGRRALLALVQRLGVADRVEHLGFVETVELDGLYRGAIALVHPSLYEGFGLTVLEAMAAEVPVIASDIPAIREVGGDAIRYVDRPLSPAAWAEAIEELLRRPHLPKERATQGEEMARRHTWAGAARDVAILLGDLCGRPQDADVRNPK